MMNMQRYRVSLWSYQSRLPGESPLYLRKETVSSSESGALRGVMRQAGISSAHCAKVVNLRANTCQFVQNICLQLS